MTTCTLQDLGNLRDLVEQAQRCDDPVIVFDGEDECLVAMRPAVFERVLFDNDALNREKRESLHL